MKLNDSGQKLERALKFVLKYCLVNENYFTIYETHNSKTVLILEYNSFYLSILLFSVTL